jgi:hypothetical protein
MIDNLDKVGVVKSLAFSQDMFGGFELSQRRSNACD